MTAGYELLDFGAGRKLERFGSVIVDRPSPAADNCRKAEPDRWREAAARFERSGGGEQGDWKSKSSLPDAWQADFALTAEQSLTFELRASPFGHVGVFPEQQANWQWLLRQCRQVERPLRVLNLFAYTGGSTLAAAAGGAEVVHIDAARNIVRRARRNAELSGLADRTIRWINEDAVKFCRREANRKNKYDAIILDPPTYGHGPGGEVWKIGTDLLPLLECCRELTDGQPRFVLLTCHSSGIGPAELSAYLADGIFGHCRQPPASGELFVATADGRQLPSGVFARWPA